MKDLVLTDVGGSEIDPREIITDELIGFVEGINPTLGTAADPYHKEYHSFLEEIAAAGVVTIDPESMSAGRFDDVDLSGREDEVKDIPDSHFVPFDPAVFTALALAMCASPFDGKEVDGFVFTDVFATPFGDYEQVAVAN